MDKCLHHNLVYVYNLSEQAQKTLSQEYDNNTNLFQHKIPKYLIVLDINLVTKDQ
jgi:hypothetical protein